MCYQYNLISHMYTSAMKTKAPHIILICTIIFTKNMAELSFITYKLKTFNMKQHSNINMSEKPSDTGMDFTTIQRNKKINQ